MTQQELLEAEVPMEKLDQLSREEILQLFKLEQSFRIGLQRYVRKVEALNEELKEQKLNLEDKYVVIKNKFFGKSSERSPKSQNAPTDSSSDPAKKPKEPRVLLPSERYPDAPLIERHIELETLPDCGCCGKTMEDSGMTEDSEFLTIIPKQYLIILQMRHKYRCGHCHGDLKTAPTPPRIKEGGSLSDEMAIDVAMSKYCDLVPIERYAKMAEREGLKDLPPQSLIENTHYLAEFVKAAYEKLKKEILASHVLHADETPHRMLEGDKKNHWFLWGFSTKTTSYFECHNTRSGDVAHGLLENSKCRYLASDVYSGYGKAVRITNEKRTEKGLRLIRCVYCNAHARRYFKQAEDSFPDESKFFVDQYKEIYKLEDLAKDKPPDEVLALRTQMRPYFLAIKKRCKESVESYSNKSSLAKAMKYFLKNYGGLIRFTKNPALPIDNNPQERLLRNPVIGRKTWYGTHSKQGAKTAAILFSLVESCKLNGVNPRLYFKKLVQDLHSGLESYTPNQFKIREDERARSQTSSVSSSLG
jgi:transposase